METVALESDGKQVERSRNGTKRLKIVQKAFSHFFASMAFDKQDTFALGNSMKNLDFSGRVGAIQCPTLLLCGEKDGANLKSARFLAQNIPGAELQILQHTGHVVNEEAPAVLAERLNAFYAAHP